MTLRTHLVVAALLASWNTGSALAAVGAGSANVTVRLTASNAASVGRALPVSCVAVDAAGIKSVTIEAVGSDGVKVVVPVVDQVDLGGGAVQVEAAWTPTKAGGSVLGCTALGISSATASGSAAAPVMVYSPLIPSIASVTASTPVVMVGKTVDLSAVASDPEGGPLRYAWSAAKGTVVGKGASAKWTAPATEGPCSIEVAVTDDTGLTVRKSVTVEASTVVFQSAATTNLRGPRRIAAAADGSFFVVDSNARLLKLTKRGDLIASVFEGARAVTFGGGFVWVGTEGGDLVKIDPVTGRIAGRIALGIAPGPVGLSYDSARDVLWVAYVSGVVDARRPDGSSILQIRTSTAGALVRLADVAVDSAAGIVWVAQDRAAAGGMIFGYRVTDGVQVRVVGANGAGPARITGALAVASDGRLYVSDAFSGTIGVLDASGTKVRTLGRLGRGEGELYRPAGMSFMANGDLLVANLDANRLDRFGNESPLPTCAGDADCDGLSDAAEQAAGLDPLDAADALADTDGDGLNNTEEIQQGTQVAVADSDGDGFADGAEVAGGFDPNNGSDHRATLTATGSGRGGPGLIQLTGSVGGLPVEVACVPAWRQVEGPAVALADASALSTSFVARAAGTYRFALDATCDGVPAVGAVAAVVVDNFAPMADAGRVVVVDPGARLSLSAAASSDANGDAIRFNWEQVSGPAVSGPVTGKTLSARFGVPGIYGFAMTATDSAGAASTAEAQVVVVGSGSLQGAASPAAPGASSSRAVATAPAVVAVGSAALLDGSASTGSGALSYAWRQVSGPAAGLRNADSAKADAYFFAPGTYLFELAVADGVAGASSARVRVEARAAGKAIPVASAVAPAAALVGERVVLDGTASVGAKNFRWTQVSGPWTVVQGGAQAAFTAPAAGVYGFELEVDDGLVRSAPARVEIVVSPNGMEN